MSKFGAKTIALAKKRAAENKFLDIGVHPEAGGWWIYDTSSEHVSSVPIEWASDRGVVDDAVKKARRAWERALGRSNRVEVRDAAGVRARPRSLAAAHRATRRANMTGTRVSTENRAGAGGETWINPRAFEPKSRATPEYVEQVVDAIVRYRRGTSRQDARRLVAEHARLVDGYHDVISTGWGKPEDPDRVARVLLARSSSPAPTPPAWRWEEHRSPPAPPPTAYRLATVREMVLLGMHEGTAEGVADFLEIDGPRKGSHETPRQAAKWATSMQRRIAAAGGT